jgi:membrane fusion protein (multidrug efflux system)
MADHTRNIERQDHGASQPSAVKDVLETPASAATAAPPVRRWRPRKQWLLYGVLLLLIGLGAPYGWRLWEYYHTHESTDDAYVVGDIVPISARVTGTVLAVHIEDHQRVEAGQLLVQLDPRDFALRVQQAEAAVAIAAAHVHRAALEVPLMQESTSSDTARTSATLRTAQSAQRESQLRIEEAQARLRSQEAAVATAQAEVEKGQARLDMSRTAFARIRQLLADGVMAQQQFDEAESSLRSAQAEWRATQQKLEQSQRELERTRVDLRTRQQAVEQAQGRVAEAQALLTGSQANRQNVDIKQAQVQVARAQLQQAQADLEYAQQQLAYTTLYAPVAGVVAKKNLEAGQVIQAGRPGLAIVSAQHVWVEANFKETQLRHMRAGQQASLAIDAYPDHVFTGTVASISPGTGSVFSLLPPENATGNFVKVVQRVPVKIVLEPASHPEMTLRPGMSAIATVTTR